MALSQPDYGAGMPIATLRAGQRNGADMLDDRESLTVGDDELISAEERYELWEWARAAGVSAEDLRRALLPLNSRASRPDR